jgi:hypothetical protein
MENLGQIASSTLDDPFKVFSLGRLLQPRPNFKLLFLPPVDCVLPISKAQLCVLQSGVQIRIQISYTKC